MNTFELLIVFAAFMAVIALVAIAIDWVGRPLRNRRFIPRIYRYDDEILDVPFDQPVAMPVGAAAPVAVAAVPVPVAVVPMAGPPVLAPTDAEPAPVTGAPGHAAAELAPGFLSEPAPQAAPPTREAFTATVAEDDSETVFDTGSRRRGIASTVPVAAAAAWNPGMALDARVGDRKPTVSVKAERFWKDTAAHLGEHSHFDERSRELMREGKPPRRRNPRTGDVEAMELVGLRAAARRGDVRMRWPDDAVDPWSAS